MDRAMDRAAAAALLGVTVDADGDEVRRAYRVWARIAHPDAGGDPEHFERVSQARRVLLQAVPESPSASAPATVVRAPLASVLQRPRNWTPLLIAGVVVVSLAALPRLGVGPVAAAALAGVTSSALAVLVARSILSSKADTGHRMRVIVLAWLPIAILLVAVSAGLGTGFVSVLPVIALPLVAVVGWLNAGAGLWRPAMAPRAR